MIKRLHPADASSSRGAGRFTLTPAQFDESHASLVDHEGLEELLNEASDRVAADAIYIVTGSHARWRVELESQSEQIGAALQLLEQD